MPRTRKPIREDVHTGNPPAVAPGQPYGERQAIEQSVAQIPLPTQAGQAQPTTAPAPNPVEDAQNHPFDPVNLFGPTAQPGVPVTHGLPTGPGGGPEALIQPNPDAETLKRLVPLLEILASGPDSTHATRNFLRVLRSSVG